MSYLRLPAAAALALVSCALGFCPQKTWAAPPAAPCPVSYSSLSMPLKHQGGMSTPVVKLDFTNETKKKIVQAKFGLILIDSEGHAAPYAQGLTFTAGAEPGKVVSSDWELDLEKIDIEHQGETVYLKSARFDDNTTWQDDGYQRCKQEVYYGPK